MTEGTAGARPGSAGAIDDLGPVGVVGLGYVGLPVAMAFGAVVDTLGFDVSTSRVDALRAGVDHTGEVDADDWRRAGRLRFSSDAASLAGCRSFIVAVPTPVDDAKRPDFSALRAASATVGAVLKSGDLVVFESTVYPGATEEVCVPELERASGLRFNVDFHVGYSPERINPGDRTRRLADIVKVTSGSTPEAAERVDRLYRAVVTAGTHLAPSIRVAEAAKVIENTQRDLNIALMNELATLFERLGIDTLDVLAAAGTKWNFLPFRPGLVGGHCIGVDPYYLTHKAQAVGHAPEVILAGRRINDSMGGHVAMRVAKGLGQRGLLRPGARVLVAGLAFKENCPDLRNTRVIDVIRGLEDFGLEVVVHDPRVDAAEAEAEYGVALQPQLPPGPFAAVVLAVPHAELVARGASSFRTRLETNGLLFDVRGALPRADVDDRL
jgi:UDP-N-acetyl-D-galactosamine dehydrogenase